MTERSEGVDVALDPHVGRALTDALEEAESLLMEAQPCDDCAYTDLFGARRAWRLAMARKETAILRRQLIDLVGGKFVKRVEHWPVRVMARAEGYAMVRRPGAMPMVVSEKDLAPNEQVNPRPCR